MRRFLSFSAFVVVFSAAFIPALAHAGIIEFLFPSLRQEEYDPTKEMIAPFAVGQGVEEKDKLDGLPVNAVSLSKPHRLSQEIGQWVMTAASEAMNFDAGNVQQQFSSRDHFFDTVGKNQYLTFLRDQKILGVVQDGRFHVRSYSDQMPLLLNEGVVNERYRWLFRVPVVVTYLDKNVTSYKRGAEPKLVQKAVLNIQIGRIQADDKPEGLQIEQWSGKMEPMEAPEDTMP